MSLKVLFLDFNGVLDCIAHRWALPGDVLPPGKTAYLTEYLPAFNTEAVARVAEIVKRTDARIVVSSTMRLFNTLADMREMLNESGYPDQCPIIGKTPRGFGGIRGYEIHAWLLRAKRRGWNVESFCILDDDDDMVHLMPRLVQTSKTHGLQQQDVERAVRLLNR